MNKWATDNEIREAKDKGRKEALRLALDELEAMKDSAESWSSHSRDLVNTAGVPMFNECDAALHDSKAEVYAEIIKYIKSLR